MDPIINKLCMNMIKKFNISVEIKDQPSVSDSEAEYKVFKRKITMFKEKNRSTGLNLEHLHLDESEDPRNTQKVNKTLYEGSNASQRKLHLTSLNWEDRMEVYDMKTVLKT